MFSVVDWLSTRNRFSHWGKNISTRLFTEPWQVRDMVGVSMRKKNELHIQSVALRKPDHFTGISACIKGYCGATRRVPDEDRKSTRLNSSHVSISYAVFCLKK